ncbi:MAG TPA: class I SAM-dependent methyltransferase [Acidimicrobiales bacterium]|nr:class I SAM-dependent methyltransferase [Acidimicrobiales bacterium]
MSERPPPSGAALWDEHAGWWKKTFTHGADIEYEREILPLVTAELGGLGLVLDLGCGEGQVARALAAAGPAVVGLDPSRAQLDNARAEGGGPRLVCGAGEALPFAGGSLGGVVCCLAIEHSDDPDALLGEVARVLVPGGTLLLLVNHPMYQGPGSGFVDDQILDEHYWRVGPYLSEQVTVEQVDAGVAIPFAHRPLSRYLNPLAALDLLLVEMHEPPPLPEFLAGSVDPALEGAIPRLLAMRFEHRPRR